MTKDAFVKKIVDQWIDKMEFSPENKLLSPSMQKEKVRLEITDTLKQLIQAVQVGIESLAQTLEQLSQQDPVKFPKESLNELYKIQNNAKLHEIDLTNNSEELICLKDVYGISDAAMETFFEAVNYLYNQQRYDEACNILFYLCNLDPAKNIYWFTLGNAEYLKNDFQRAIYAYSGAFLTNTADPRSLILAASCFEELKQLDRALNMVECAMDVVHDNPELASEWEREIRDYQSMLNKKIIG